jgi:hypothetical protein
MRPQGSLEQAVIEAVLNSECGKERDEAET